jgi:ribosome biogenesis protein SLX9
MVGQPKHILTCLKQAVKKRTTLRDKHAKSNTKSNLSGKIAELKEENNGQESDYHENPFLKLLKVTKKDKQLNKSQNFSQKFDSSTLNTSSNISKSALRRRKRNARNELKPKMDELLQNLPETTNVIDPSAAAHKPNDHKLTKFIKSTKASANLPNATKQTGHAKIMTQESKNFTNVLKNPQFRSSPFSALKDAIAQNIQNQ